MLISREMDYALRIIRALSTGPRSAQEIADAENITRPITLKVLNKLKKVNLVDSIRGQDGGYVLRDGWASLTLYDLFSATDEDLYVNRCLCPKYACDNCGDGCNFCDELARIQNILHAELSSKTLAEILKI